MSVLLEGATLLRAAAPGTVDRGRRLLLISPGFPPASAVGGLRWQKMLRVLEERGWSADVLTVLLADPREQDPARLEDLPPGTQVFAVPQAALEDRVLRRIAQLLGRVRRVRASSAGEGTSRSDGAVRSSGRLPSGGDAATEGEAGARSRQAFRLAVYRRGQRIAARALADACRRLPKGRYAAIVSSGPPHSAHLAARMVAARLQLPWIMDWRDPWTFDEFLAQFDPVAYARAERPAEARCVRDASLIVVNTPPVARQLAELYPEAAHRILTIPNGADAEEIPRPRRDERFRVVYAGSLFEGRDPRIFMRAMRDLRDRHGIPERELVLQLVTNQDRYDGRPLVAWVREYGVASMVEFHGFMPRSRLLEWLAGTAVNVLVQIPSTYQIPAKLFEYMQQPAWLVAVTNPPNAISEMLEGSTGIVVPPDHARLADELASLHQRWRSGEFPSPVNDGRYDRLNRAEEMRAALERVTRG